LVRLAKKTHKIGLRDSEAAEPIRNNPSEARNPRTGERDQEAKNNQPIPTENPLATPNLATDWERPTPIPTETPLGNPPPVQDNNTNTPRERIRTDGRTNPRENPIDPCTYVPP
jgi:hypothetical protein